MAKYSVGLIGYASVLVEADDEEHAKEVALRVAYDEAETDAWDIDEDVEIRCEGND